MFLCKKYILLLYTCLGEYVGNKCNFCECLTGCCPGISCKSQWASWSTTTTSYAAGGCSGDATSGIDTSRVPRSCIGLCLAVWSLSWPWLPIISNNLAAFYAVLFSAYICILAQGSFCWTEAKAKELSLFLKYRTYPKSVSLELLQKRTENLQFNPCNMLTKCFVLSQFLKSPAPQNSTTQKMSVLSP